MISALDNDIYKITCLELFWKHPELSKANAIYKVFTRRSKWPFKKYEHLKNALNKAASVRFTIDDINYLQSLNKFSEDFLNWLRCRSLQTKYISLFSDHIEITGPLLDITLWEIPILSAINELNQKTLSNQDWKELREKYVYDSGKLNKCQFAEFGSRRRHSLGVQDLAVSTFFEFSTGNFLGTSNMYLAKKYGIQPIGTIPHEYPMALLAVCGEENAANDVMCASLPDGSIMLADTFTTDQFLRNVDKEDFERFAGVRQDSGDPIEVGWKIFNHYRTLCIDPMTKTIIFSDGLNPDKCLEIQEKFKNKIGVKFGIGTYFSNSFNPIDCVMKLTHVNGRKVYKISDNPEKSTKET